MLRLAGFLDQQLASYPTNRAFRVRFAYNTVR